MLEEDALPLEFADLGVDVVHLEGQRGRLLVPANSER